MAGDWRGGVKQKDEKNLKRKTYTERGYYNGLAVRKKKSYAVHFSNFSYPSPPTSSSSSSCSYCCWFYTSTAAFCFCFLHNCGEGKAEHPHTIGAVNNKQTPLSSVVAAVAANTTAEERKNEGKHTHFRLLLMTSSIVLSKHCGILAKTFTSPPFGKFTRIIYNLLLVFVCLFFSFFSYSTPFSLLD